VYNYIGLGLNFEIRWNGIRWNETKHAELEQFLHAFTSRGFHSVSWAFLLNRRSLTIWNKKAQLTQRLVRQQYVYWANACIGLFPHPTLVRWPRAGGNPSEFLDEFFQPKIRDTLWWKLHDPNFDRFLTDLPVWRTDEPTDEIVIANSTLCIICCCMLK